MKHSISAHNSSYHLSSMAVEGDDLAFVLQLQKLCSWKKSMNSVLKYLKVKCEAVSPTAKAFTNFLSYSRITIPNTAVNLQQNGCKR